MLAHCFNPQLVRGRVQSSDWPAQLSIRVKRVLNMHFYTVSDIRISKFFGSFNNDIIFQNSFAF